MKKISCLYTGLIVECRIGSKQMCNWKETSIVKNHNFTIYIRDIVEGIVIGNRAKFPLIFRGNFLVNGEIFVK